ncbi:MAG: cupredoxin domain-containing protein [Solirubrobacterales bacterium]
MESSTRGSRFRFVITTLVVAIPLALVPAGSAGAATITAAAECCTFVGNPFSQAAGIEADLLNPGLPNRVPHNVYASQKGADGGPLFYSSLAVPGTTVPVRGTEYLQAGSYRFTCTLHTGMNGMLEVSPGTAVSRPRVTPSVKSSSLTQVRRKGRIDLGLKADSDTGPVTVTVTANGSLVATGKVESLRPSAVRSLSVRLSAKGRKAIAKGSSVRFKVSAVAEFGLLRSATRVLKASR